MKEVKEVEGVLISKNEQIRGSKSVKILEVELSNGKKIYITDWQQTVDFDDQIHFKSDGIQVRKEWLFKYSEEPSKALNPKTNKPYTNRNLITIMESPKVRPPAKKVEHNEIEDESEPETGSVEQDISEIKERIKTIEKFVAEDFDIHDEMLKGLIASLARTEAKLDALAGALKVEDTVEFVKASEI